MKPLVEQYLENSDNMRVFQQERAIYRVTELIESVMQAEGITRSELAKRLGRNKGWVTQLLDGEANKTIRTVADVLAVMGREFRSSATPIRIGGIRQSVANEATIVFSDAWGTDGRDWNPTIKSNSLSGSPCRGIA
jgi:transcriptional regulator with XRE-family HTH domain